MYRSPPRRQFIAADHLIPFFLRIEVYAGNRISAKAVIVICSLERVVVRGPEIRERPISYDWPVVVSNMVVQQTSL